MKLNRTDRSIALVALMVVAVSALLLVADYHAEVSNHRALLLTRGQTTLDALYAGLRAHGRMGRFRHERLGYIFDELAQTPDILSVSLWGRGQEPVVMAGDHSDSPVPLVEEGAHWGKAALSLCRTIELGGGGPGRGMEPGRGRLEEEGAWAPMEPGPYRVQVTLDTRAMILEVRRDRTRSLATLVVVLLMVLCASAAWAGALRRRQLQTSLLLAQEQTAHQTNLTRLGAGLAHETKNPLGIIRGHAQLIVDADEEGTEEVRERAGIIVDEIDRVVGQIDGFLTLARPNALTLETVDLSALIDGLVQVLNNDAQHRGVGLRSQADGLWVEVDGPQLRRALMNLLLNGIQACDTGGTVEIVAEESPSGIDIRVVDSGCGIAAEDLERVTDPYFTRRRGGCGLGLALVKQIAMAHGWELCIASDLGNGSVVYLRGLAKGKRDASV